MLFKDRWIEENVHKLRTIYPNESIDLIREYVTEMYETNFKDSKCIAYNNYEKEQINTTISKMIDWIDKVKPITTESGSLFKQHSQSWNPDTTILQGILDGRKAAKAKKFETKEASKAAKTPEEKKEFLELSNRWDLTQRRLKVIANSEYGVSGLSSSWFFNMACASATTARGQALISTAETAFEDFLADNVLFMDMDECIRFVECIKSEALNRRLKDHKWIENKSIEDVVKRLTHKFIEDDIADIELIKQYVQNLDQEDLNRIYYKSNLEEFFRNSDRARNILQRICVATEIQYLDPMKPPKEFKESLIKLREAVLEYVHFNHPTTDRVYRLKTHPRKRVIVIDTDSKQRSL